MRGRTPNQPGWPALLIRWLTVVIAKFFFFLSLSAEEGTEQHHHQSDKSQALGQDKTRQDKKVTSFQPAWLIRCSTPHQGQPSAIFSCLHLRIWQPATDLAAT